MGEDELDLSRTATAAGEFRRRHVVPTANENLPALIEPDHIRNYVLDITTSRPIGWMWEHSLGHEVQLFQTCHIVNECWADVDADLYPAGGFYTLVVDGYRYVDCPATAHRPGVTRIDGMRGHKEDIYD